MYKIENVINAKATAVINGRETELFVGDELTQEQLDTLKVYGDKLIYRIDQNCTKDVCGVDIGAYQATNLPALDTEDMPVKE
jgi:hypothetical protein